MAVISLNLSSSPHHHHFHHHYRHILGLHQRLRHNHQCTINSGGGHNSSGIIIDVFIIIGTITISIIVIILFLGRRRRPRKNHERIVITTVIVNFIHNLISRLPDQNGVSQACYIVEIHHCGSGKTLDLPLGGKNSGDSTRSDDR